MQHRLSISSELYFTFVDRARKKKFFFCLVFLIGEEFTNVIFHAVFHRLSSKYLKLKIKLNNCMTGSGSAYRITGKLKTYSANLTNYLVNINIASVCVVECTGSHSRP